MPNRKLDVRTLITSADRLRVMAHPARIAIITLLTEHKTLNVSEIYQKLNMSQSSVSHHLILLKNKAILKSRKEGNQIFYSLNSQNILKVLQCIDKSNH